MVALAHCDISFYQLMAINKMKICSEAFGTLINNMFLSEIFSAEDILRPLKDSEYLKQIWKDLFRQLLSIEKRENCLKNCCNIKKLIITKNQ